MAEYPTFRAWCMWCQAPRYRVRWRSPNRLSPNFALLCGTCDAGIHSDVDPPPVPTWFKNVIGGI